MQIMEESNKLINISDWNFDKNPYIEMNKSHLCSIATLPIKWYSQYTTESEKLKNGKSMQFLCNYRNYY